MKLIVGLGNPGKEYDGTRHNVGFMVLDSFCKNATWQKKFQGEFYKTEIHNETVCFLKPTTFMNNSGFAVSELVNFFHIPLENILVIQDDLDLPLGNYKLKRNSSSGGHNGIQSIIDSLNSSSFLRLKVGITFERESDTIQYVLGRFSKSEVEMLTQNFEVYHQIILSFITQGVEKTLQSYSKK